MADIHRQIRNLMFKAMSNESMDAVAGHFGRARKFVDRICNERQEGFNCNEAFCKGLEYYGYELKLVKIEEEK